MFEIEKMGGFKTPQIPYGTITFIKCCSLIFAHSEAKKTVVHLTNAHETLHFDSKAKKSQHKQ